MKTITADISQWFEISDRLFYTALLTSLLIHLALILYLSSEKGVKILSRPLKQIEVTYQQIQPKTIEQKKEEVKPVAAVKEEAAKKVEILDKKPQDLPIFGEKMRDISKLSDHLRFSQKESPKIKTLDVSRNISIPVLQTEKISNPGYLSYNQHIREKIKQQAYRHIEHPEFQAGEVYLTFILAANGTLRDLQVIESRSHASDFLKAAGLRSIKEANPFPPFPKELTYPELTFNVVISFEVNN